MSLNLAQYLDFSASAHPDHVAVRLDDQAWTYTELAERARRVANVLRAQGVKRGDKVAMLIPNTPEFAAPHAGILYTGATDVPVNCLLKGNEVAY